ncbi:hypothetical protein ACS0TY_004163 [Phlomoides rotata]
MVGRVCLVNLVITSSLVHSMMIYQWPRSLLGNIEGAVRNFLWFGNIDRHGFCIVPRSCTCAPRGKGANEAFLQKLAWTVINNKDANMEFVRVRYFKPHEIRSQYITTSVWKGLKPQFIVFWEMHDGFWVNTPQSDFDSIFGWAMLLLAKLECRSLQEISSTLLVQTIILMEHEYEFFVMKFLDIVVLRQDHEMLDHTSNCFLDHEILDHISDYFMSKSSNINITINYDLLDKMICFELNLGKPEISLDISFGFNDPKYSDRTLLLEIIDDADSDDDPSHLVPNVKHDGDLLITATTAPRVKTVHISSLILAARSTFFRKLFSNGMLESEQNNARLRINTSEEASLMYLLKYIYNNNLPTTLKALLDLSVTADKFEAASCFRDCIRSLQNLPMTCESAALYFDLPPSVLMSPIVQPLADAAKQFLIAKFKDLDKFKKEMLNLTLAGIQAVLSSDDLEVTSEDVVYDFVVTWAHKHYSDLEERRGILKTHLLHLVRFPLMTTKKLIEEVQTCNDIDPEVASKIVIHALGFKAETPYRKRCIGAEEGDAASRQFVERAYKHRPIKVVELAFPHQQCIVYLDLTREELMHIFPGGDQIRSETFHLGGLALTLLSTFLVRNQHLFWLGLEVVGSRTCTVKYETALRTKPSEEFENCLKESDVLNEPRCISLFHGMQCTELIGDDSIYFINDILHVRVVITIKK